jgi:hypothetical protein
MDLCRTSLSLVICSKDFILREINNPPSIAAAVRIPKKTFLSGILSQKLAITPATLPPNEVDKNHPPNPSMQLIAVVQVLKQMKDQ